jgi:hypothetical protein
MGGLIGSMNSDKDSKVSTGEKVAKTLFGGGLMALPGPLLQPLARRWQEQDEQDQIQSPSQPQLLGSTQR